MRHLSALLMLPTPAFAAAPPTPGAWKPPSRLAVLPPHYRHLDLTEAQLRQLHSITLWYAPRTAQLEADIAALRKAAAKLNAVEAVRDAVRRTVLISDLHNLRLAELAEKEAVLTPGQQKKLKELKTGRGRRRGEVGHATPGVYRVQS